MPSALASSDAGMPIWRAMALTSAGIFPTPFAE